MRLSALPTGDDLLCLSTPAVLLDRAGRIVAVNGAWGDAPGCGVGVSYLDVCRRSSAAAPEAGAVAAGIGQVLAGERAAFGLDYACPSPDAPLRWCAVLCTPVAEGALVTHLDASGRYGSALCDGLTGLANRGILVDRLRAAIAAGRRAGVLFLDLDDFKLVNDGFGHAAGDRLLADVARRLSLAVRPLDVVARLGGDEFGVLCEDLADERDVLMVAARLRDALAEPFDVAGRRRHVRASIGCRLLAPGEVEPEDAADVLLRDADVAMYQAKEAGKDRVEVFSAATRAGILQRVELEADLRRAIEADELEVHYQPHVDLVTQRIVGVEALARWTHPERGPVSPAEFIPVAERSGLIIPLGDRVVEVACRDAARWRAAGVERLALSVNVAVQQLSVAAFAERVGACLRAAGLAPSDLCVEVTEGTLMDTDGAGRSTLEALRALGVYVAIDDFGTGYSSLSYLKRLPVEVLKVDRGFVNGPTRATRRSSRRS